ncbi:DNA polymerase III subunit alpha [Peribacillus saganii]|uniref:DNA polymerase III subunit alpha n=1 Tax=Peribacillus saganii TaxID=2303992 RepID=A0A372LRC1_9BACI|nr:DNA polymerase III subunit alpha [Peribacillus saganii]RFU70745.1 DNA polymerase III subunit alpha [Peribacillus saganii]
MSFIHLHIQSGYSLLSSTIKIENLVAEAKKNEFTALALTDRNVMYGSIAFYKECKKQGIKPLLGLLADVVNGQDESRPLLLLAKNLTGYENLLKISSAIKTKSPSGIPEKWLKAYAGGMLAVSPGKEGEIEQLLAGGNITGAEQTLQKWQSMFGGDSVYLSIQRTSVLGEEELNGKVIEFSRRTAAPLAAVNPVYYLGQEDSLAYEVLLAVRDGAKLSDEERVKPESKEHYLKNGRKMADLFSDVPDALENTLKIAGRCNVEIPLNRQLLPKYPVHEGVTAEEMLEAVCEKGLEMRYPNAPKAYWERLYYELGIIKKMKFSDYFLIVWDFMKFAKQKNILTGPGRGSAAGSMVAYVLSITDVDPIEHKLLFERFLNPERISMPDIDIDFPDNRREEVISYVASKYGELHVAQIITFGTMAAKAALRDVGRVFGLNSKEQERLSRTVPSRLGITLEGAYKESQRLREFVAESSINRSVFQTALKLEGLPRHTSTHAAGVIISDQPLTDLIAIQEGHEGIHLTQFPMDVLEELGLLKMDFLGLRNLTLLENIMSSIKKGIGKSVEISKIPLDDPATFELLSRGETTGIFQLESEGMRKVLMKLKPGRFEDIVAVNALYRPGPMENIPLFIERKHGLKPINYIHHDLKDILTDTYGVIVYQEQIMQIASRMAGFSLGQADLLRRAVSKKKKEVLDQQREHFVKGSLSMGYSEQISHDVYDMIVRFANYGFNRSHAVAYSFIAYQLAYLKAHYPDYFMAALMTSVIGNEDKISQYVREAKHKGMNILPPSINHSGYPFSVEKEGLRYSLAAIKGIGGAALREIFQARKNRWFSDLFDFCLRISGKTINRKVLEMLVHSGAFDEFGEDRATLLASLDVALSHSELVNPNDDQFDLFADAGLTIKPKYMVVEPIRLEDKLALEREALGLYLSDHPVSAFKALLEETGASDTVSALAATDPKVLIGAYITSLKTIRTKKGEVMAFLTLSDEGGELEAVVFPDVYKKHANTLKAGSILVFQGSMEEREGKKQLIVQRAFSAENLKEILNSSRARLFLKIEMAQQNAHTLQKLKQTLRKYSGATKVMLYYEREDRYVQLSLIDWVTPGAELLTKLSMILGEKNVRLMDKK